MKIKTTADIRDRAEAVLDSLMSDKITVPKANAAKGLLLAMAYTARAEIEYMRLTGNVTRLEAVPLPESAPSVKAA